MSLSNYERAYLEINRIMIDYKINSRTGILSEVDINKLNQQVNENIKKYPDRKEQIYDIALEELLIMVKKGIDFYKYTSGGGKLTSRTINRLNKFYNKNSLLNSGDHLTK